MNLLHYFHTVRHLQWKQVYYMLLYKIKKPLFRQGNIPATATDATRAFPSVQWHTCMPDGLYAPGNKTFSFLNIAHSFNDRIDWDFEQHGKLWTYNLNYFSWLEDETIPVKDRLQTIQEYINAPQHRNGDEPYPTSLRCIHWIQFVSRHRVNDDLILKQLYADYRRLATFPEYQLGGNHLLENAFSLYWGALFFKNESWLRLSATLLCQNLEEQILPDGGHYERSPMYHCLLLYRLLQCIELAQHLPAPVDDGLHQLMKSKAAHMLGWLHACCFTDGPYAMTGDTAPGVAPLPASLAAFARDLDIEPGVVALKESGYRKRKGRNWELLFNAGNITPAHQPGHAHADSLSFWMQVNNQPFITDTGISTYEANERRQLERGTAAHNTVTINARNSSEVWKSFRMAQRATVVIGEEHDDRITAAHDGYRQYGIIHERTIACSDEKISITDVIKNQKANKALLHLHFHPSVVLKQKDAGTFTANGVNIILEGITDAHPEQYIFCEGFNKLKMAQKLVATIHGRADIVLEF